MNQDDLQKAKEAMSRKDMATTLVWARKHLAANPGHVEAATMVARALADEAPDTAVSTLQRAIADNKEAQAKLALTCELLPYLEQTRRAAHGLPPYHVLDMREFPFHFCHAEIEGVRQMWKSFAGDAATTLNMGPAVEFILGNLAAADSLLLRTAETAKNKRAPGSFATVRYAPEFYKNLDNVDLRGLPEVQVLKQAQFSTQHVLFVGCNLDYLQLFAVPLLRSLAAKAPGADAHVHLMVVEGQSHPQIPSLDLNLHITYEVIHKGLDSPMYYHAMRLVRFYQFLQDRALWMADVDGLLNSDPGPLYARLQSGVGIRVHPGRVQPWNQFNASLVAAAPDSKDYFRLVANYIAHFMLAGNFTWGMDQMALYGVYQYLERKPQLTLWSPSDFAQYECDDDAVFWFTAGALKNEYARGALPPPPQHKKYWDAFQKYAQ